MITRRTGNDSDRKPARYRVPVGIGLAGVIVIMLVLGFLIPGWEWLALFGFLLLLVFVYTAAYIIRLPYFARWIPTLFAGNERDNGNNLPPPPTIDGWS